MLEYASSRSTSLTKGRDRQGHGTVISTWIVDLDLNLRIEFSVFALACFETLRLPTESSSKLPLLVGRHYASHGQSAHHHVHLEREIQTGVLRMLKARERWHDRENGSRVVAFIFLRVLLIPGDLGDDELARSGGLFFFFDVEKGVSNAKRLYFLVYPRIKCCNDFSDMLHRISRVI